MSGVSVDRISELNEQITQLALKTTAQEPAALFMEFSALEERQTKWNKGGKIVGAVIGLGAFFVVDSIPFSGFPNEDVVLATVAALLLATATMVAVMLLGKYSMRAQIADWVQRADRIVREYQSAKS